VGLFLEVKKFPYLKLSPFGNPIFTQPSADPRVWQTPIFKTKIAQEIQKRVQTNQLPTPPVSDFFKLLFSVPKIAKKIGRYHF
jgi:hypothetical protein